MCVPNFRPLKFLFVRKVVGRDQIQIYEQTRQSRRYAENPRDTVEASGRPGDFFEKTKKQFLDKVYGSMWTKFQVCIFIRLARRHDTITYIHIHINKNTHIQVNFGISSTGCSPHVDFDIKLTNACVTGIQYVSYF